MRIPWQELSKEALRGVIEDYVSREGTDYGDREYSLADKRQQVLRQLERGEVVISFDAESETCSLMRID